MGLKEILEAKRAAAQKAAEATAAPASAAAQPAAPIAEQAKPESKEATTQGEALGKAPVAQTSAASSQAASSSNEKNILPTQQSETQPQATQSVTSSSAPSSASPTSEAKTGNKPLSFAEKMALAKQKSNASTSSSAPASTPSPAAAAPSSPLNSDVASAASEQLASSPLAALADDPQRPSPASPVSNLIQQAAWQLQSVSTEHIGDDVSEEVKVQYVDLATKIRNLNEASEADLKGEMAALKKALYQNPQAASLFLPEEIGAMVVALRKIVGETIVEKTTAAKPGRKAAAKDKPLSAEQLEAGWDDL